jgi:hypothetical protein
MVAQASPARAYYLAHPSVGVVEAGGDWPSPVPESRLGAHWTALDDQAQTAREDAFSGRLLHSVVELWPDATYLVEYPYGDGPPRPAEGAGGSTSAEVVP